MGKDVSWKEFFSDNARYADIINGICGQGKQLVCAHDLHEKDTQIWEQSLGPECAGEGSDDGNAAVIARTGNRRSVKKRKQHRTAKSRDLLRKVAFGMNFIIIGIENQENLDYALPLRMLVYDTGEYQKQAAKIRKRNRKRGIWKNSGEYLYKFCKSDRLQPCVTFILYSGMENWDGARSLHELLDFNGIPSEIRALVQDYKIHLISINEFEDTDVFKTDVKQVFDFIRCSRNKDKLRELVKNDPVYQTMEEEAFDVITHYTNASELISKKEDYRKGGNYDMCKAIQDLIEDGKTEGRAAGRAEGRAEERTAAIKVLICTCKELGASRDLSAEKVSCKYNLSQEETERYLEECW